jgi:diguanylate cyclase
MTTLSALLSRFLVSPTVLVRQLCARALKTYLAAALTGCVSLGAMAGVTAEPLLLDDQNSVIDAWPHVRLLSDGDKTLTVDQAIAQLSQFESPPSKNATLGVRADTVWLRVPIQTSSTTDGHWIVEIDYPPLQYIDAYLLDQGVIKQRAKFGSLRPFESRPLLSRSHALEIDVAPSRQYELLLRLESAGALVLPLTFEKPSAFHSTAVVEQTIQGLLIGLGISLLFYSLSQWWSTRETLFLKYSLLVIGSLLFVLLQLGVGTQYVWKNNMWIQYHMSGIAALIAIGGTFLFLEAALRDASTSQTLTGRTRPIFQRIMWGGAVLCALLITMYSLDAFSTATVTVIVTVLGPIPSLLCMPQFIQRARKRDAIGIYLLLAWTIYMFGVMIITAVIRGKIAVNFWTLHSFQFSATFDMLAWMYVLSLRTKATRKAVEHASLERDIMRALAHTDPLTGLANRRSLNDALSMALRRSAGDNLLAVYVIDIDEFKPVNDTHGHDTGDELLVAISQLLSSHVRSGDVVARFGGDEFVVLAHGLRSEHKAQELAISLLGLFKAPIELKACAVKVGLTIGFAIAPLDGGEAITLIKRADDAMYRGKQSGKNCVRRAGG